MTRRIPQPAGPLSGLILAVGIALALTGGVATARAGEAVPRMALPADHVLHAGERVEIRWDAPAGEIEELELRLSIDGGRHYAVRVSPELEGGRSRFVWVVPNLASADARLCLRFNRDGRETDGEPGVAFRIVARADRPAELGLVHENEWWEGLERLGRHARRATALSDDGPRLLAGDDVRIAGTETRAPLLAPSERIFVRAAVVLGQHHTPTLPVSTLAPRTTPHRE